MLKMRERGVEVVEMHNLLAETVAIPEAGTGSWTARSPATTSVWG
jgi:arginine deiminase